MIMIMMVMMMMMNRYQTWAMNIEYSIMMI